MAHILSFFIRIRDNQSDKIKLSTSTHKLSKELIHAFSRMNSIDRISTQKKERTYKNKDIIMIKNNKAIISPSLLAADFLQIGNEINSVIAAGADWIHVDVMDGVFVPNITIGNPVVAAIKAVSSIPVDVHLMIVHPEHHIQTFVKAGANILTVHCENNANIFYTLMEIRQSGISPAVAINPGTPVAMVEPLLSLIDMVLVMTVNPGFGGQKFIPDTLQKIKQIRQWSNDRNLDLRIQVDGGINETTACLCREAGADVFVAGTSIFKFPQGYAAGIQAIRGSTAKI